MVLNGHEVEVLSSQVIEDAIESELGELYRIVFKSNIELERLGYNNGNIRPLVMKVSVDDKTKIKCSPRLVVENIEDDEVQVLVRIK